MEQQPQGAGQAPQAEVPAYTGSGWYRVQGDWEGGGFGYTLHFASAADAQAWGDAKARFHRAATVSVALRQADHTQVFQEAANAAQATVAGDLSEADLKQIDRQFGIDPAVLAFTCPRLTANEQRALNLQIDRNPGQWL